jgi:uncharacterized protein (TIGR03083 family)
MTELERYVAAWRGTADELTVLLGTLAEADWAKPTDCPGWSVADVVAHLAALETELATGIGPRTIAPLEGRELGASWTEAGVAERRGRTPESLLEELRHGIAARAEQLAADPPTNPLARAPHTPAGLPWDNRTLLRNRVVDMWVHEQDIRRAIGQPGGMDSLAARLVADVFQAAWPFILAKKVGAPAGTTLALTVAGTRADYVVGADGRGAVAEVPVADPTVALSMTREALTVLGAGRRTPAQVAVDIGGDPDLAARLLAAAAITP